MPLSLSNTAFLGYDMLEIAASRQSSHSPFATYVLYNQPSTSSLAVDGIHSHRMKLSLCAGRNRGVASYPKRRNFDLTRPYFILLQPCVTYLRLVFHFLGVHSVLWRPLFSLSARRSVTGVCLMHLCVTFFGSFPHLRVTRKENVTAEGRASR